MDDITIVKPIVFPEWWGIEPKPKPKEDPCDDWWGPFLCRVGCWDYTDGFEWTCDYKIFKKTCECKGEWRPPRLWR